jgi:MerR family regulatory protein
LTLQQGEGRYRLHENPCDDRRLLRASRVSVKTLRHYHEVGLLEPSEVDPDDGYRYYSEDQTP